MVLIALRNKHYAESNRRDRTTQSHEVDIMPKVIAATAPHRVILRRVSGTTVVTIPAIVKRTLGWKTGETMVVQMVDGGVLIVAADPPSARQDTP